MIAVSDGGVHSSVISVDIVFQSVVQILTQKYKLLWFNNITKEIWQYLWINWKKSLELNFVFTIKTLFLKSKFFV